MPALESRRGQDLLPRASEVLVVLLQGVHQSTTVGMVEGADKVLHLTGEVMVRMTMIAVIVVRFRIMTMNLDLLGWVGDGANRGGGGPGFPDEWRSRVSEHACPTRARVSTSMLAAPEFRSGTFSVSVKAQGIFVEPRTFKDAIHQMLIYGG